jgi:Asp-tRNA(Asn)/Glu-tRNA(Gln) amidotransferase A subunit family amidase
MITEIELTISKFHEALLKKETTCELLLRSYLARIDYLDRKGSCINSIISVNPKAITRARALDKVYSNGELCGPLHGVPVLIKDNIETSDMVTTAGSLCLENFFTGRNAFVVELLRKAGAIVLAKTNLHEFALWGETISSILGQTLNPYDFTRTPGGSSGGTAAAVAASFGVIGIGTDTVNSVRSPTSACSLCGIRPTVGLISCMGVVPYSITQDTVGPIARTVEDAVRVFDVIAGYQLDGSCNPNRPKSYMDFLKADGLVGKRLGVIEGFWGKDEQSEPVNLALKPAMDFLVKSGVELVPVLSDVNGEGLAEQFSLHLFELKDNLEAYLASFGKNAPISTIGNILDSEKYTPDIREKLKIANCLSTNSQDYARRLVEKEQLRKTLLKTMDKHGLHAFIYPHQQHLVCKVGESQKKRNGSLASIAGFPAITIPGGFSEPDDNAPVGIPVGLEFMGRPYDEPELIQLAYAFEQGRKVRRPPRLM